MVVWCPDWPVVAALADEGLPTHLPAAVFSANIVQAGNDAARASGVRRGMRRRDAQSRCPELKVYAASPDRDARAFEPVLAAVEELRPGVSPLRPGLLALRAPGRFYGGEPAAAGAGRRAAGRARGLGLPGRGRRRAVHRRAGRPARRARRTAGWSRRASRSASCASCRSSVLDDLDAGEPAPAAGAAHPRRPRGPVGDRRARPVRHARSPGCTGSSAATAPSCSRPAPRRPSSPATSTSSRRWTPPRRSASASGRPPTGSSTSWPGSAWSAPRCWSRRAARGRSSPRRRGPGCTRAGSPPPTWSTGCTGSCRGQDWGRQGGDIRSPVDRVLFTPVTVVPDAVHADGLWGGTDERVERGIARVQGMLGHEAVVRPVLQGGRAPADRQALVPWGERATGLRPTGPRRPPGRAASRRPRPPGCWRPRCPRRSSASGGRTVGVDDRGAVTCEPERFRPGPARGLAAGRRLGRAVAGRGAVVGVQTRRAGGPLPGRRRRRARLADDLGRRRLVHRGGVRLMGHD